MTNLLNEGGALFIEVPNLNYVLRNLLIRCVTLQHLHYFTKKTLAILLQPFANIFCSADIDTLLIGVEKVTNTEKTFDANFFHIEDLEKAVISFKTKLDVRLAQLSKIVKDWNKEGKRIWIWGAGTAAGELFDIYKQNPKNFEGYIDSDPKKSEMRFSKAPELPIYTPEKAFDFGVDAVVIASYSVKEIMSSIAQRTCDIAVTDIYSCSLHQIPKSKFELLE
jgi:hypothetical protein